MGPFEARDFLQASADPSARCGDPKTPSQPACGAGLLDVDAALVVAQVRSHQSYDNVIGGCTASNHHHRASAFELILVLAAIVAQRKTRPSSPSRRLVADK
jgi:hypothetical protein